MEFLALPTPPLAIPRGEVLRYLGHRPGQVIEETLPLLEEAEGILHASATPRFMLGRSPVTKTSGGILVTGTSLLLPGEEIAALLSQSAHCILLAATLGGEVERKIQYYSHGRMALSVVLDATATAAIEALCDAVEERLRRVLAAAGEDVTTRYSPGYGDLPLTVQGDFLAALSAPRRMGLTASENHILMPRKSVTALMGVVPAGTLRSPGGCAVCPNYATCHYRKEGITCGHTSNS